MKTSYETRRLEDKPQGHMLSTSTTRYQNRVISKKFWKTAYQTPKCSSPARSLSDWCTTAPSSIKRKFFAWLVSQIVERRVCLHLSVVKSLRGECAKDTMGYVWCLLLRLFYGYRIFVPVIPEPLSHRLHNNYLMTLFVMFKFNCCWFFFDVVCHKCIELSLNY